jgi:hypothetical protein
VAARKILADFLRRFVIQTVPHRAIPATQSMNQPGSPEEQPGPHIERVARYLVISSFFIESLPIASLLMASLAMVSLLFVPWNIAPVFPESSAKATGVSATPTEKAAVAMARMIRFLNLIVGSLRDLSSNEVMIVTSHVSISHRQRLQWCQYFPFRRVRHETMLVLRHIGHASRAMRGPDVDAAKLVLLAFCPCFVLIPAPKGNSLPLRCRDGAH